MKYDQYNINGISFRHKSNNNIVYTIDEKGDGFKIKWHSEGRLYWIGYTTEEIIDYLNEGIWIEEPNTEQKAQVSDKTKMSKQ